MKSDLGEEIMTREQAVQMIAEALQGLAQAEEVACGVPTNRGIAAYRRRAAYLLVIDARLDERHERAGIEPITL